MLAWRSVVGDVKHAIGSVDARDSPSAIASLTHNYFAGIPKGSELDRDVLNATV